MTWETICMLFIGFACGVCALAIGLTVMESVFVRRHKRSQYDWRAWDADCN